MKDRTLFLSIGASCCIHAVVLLVNLGILQPSIARAALPAVEVELIGPPAVAAEPGKASFAGAQAKPTKASKSGPKRISELRVARRPASAEPLVDKADPIPTANVGPDVFLSQPSNADVSESSEESRIPAAVIVAETAGQNSFAGGSSGSGSVPSTWGDNSTGSWVDSAGGGGTRGRGIGGDTNYPPAYMSNPKPEYPREARRNGQEGMVVLLVEVLPNGNARKVSIEKSSGHKLLDNAAVKAVRNWRFVPAKKGANPTPAWVKIPVEFSLED